MPIRFKPHIVPPTAPTVTNANNGVSLKGGFVQLGQDVGAVGNPAALINNREIPLNNFSWNTVGSAFSMLLDDVADRWQVNDVAGNPYIQYNPAQRYVSIGDDFVANSGVELFVWDLNNRITAAVQMGAVQNAQCLQLDGTSLTYQLGDSGNNHNFTNFTIDDANKRASITAILTGQEFFTVDPLVSTYSLGDVPGLIDSTFLFLGANIFEVDLAGNVCISGELAQGRYKFGDIGGVTDGIQLFINNNPLIKIATLGTSNGAGTILTVDNNASLISFDNTAHTVGIKINNVAGFTGTVTPVNTITVNNGIVTNVA